MVTRDMKPHDTRKGATSEDNLRPQPSSFVITFKAGGCPVRNDETKDSSEAEKNLSASHFCA